jgi:tryptophan-rich sensory protein
MASGGRFDHPENADLLMRKKTTMPKIHPIASLLVFCGLSAITLAVGGWLTTAGRGDGWYASLAKPPFQPPDWAFAPAWITLMTLTAIATWRVFERRARAPRAWNIAAGLYILQLILNVSWTALFFYQHLPATALVEILVFDVVLLAMIFSYRKLDRLAAWLLAPYFAWLLFATSLNAWIVANN